MSKNPFLKTKAVFAATLSLKKTKKDIKSQLVLSELQTFSNQVYFIKKSILPIAESFSKVINKRILNNFDFGKNFQKTDLHSQISFKLFKSQEDLKQKLTGVYPIAFNFGNISFANVKIYEAYILNSTVISLQIFNLIYKISTFHMHLNNAYSLYRAISCLRY